MELSLFEDGMLLLYLRHDDDDDDDDDGDDDDDDDAIRSRCWDGRKVDGCDEIPCLRRRTTKPLLEGAATIEVLIRMKKRNRPTR